MKIETVATAQDLAPEIGEFLSKEYRLRGVIN